MENENIEEKELDFLTDKKEKLTFFQKLSSVQFFLKAPKNQFNKFGNYPYRNCEDILEAAKPLLNEFGLALVIKDEIIERGDRFYVRAEAYLYDTQSDAHCMSSAYAREPLNKKGMDESQITGAASSYARKYALNGLFCIDDTKDADTTNNHQNEPSRRNKPVTPKVEQGGDIDVLEGNNIKAEWTRLAPHLSNYAKEQIKKEFGEKEYFNNPEALKKAKELSGV